MNEQNEQNEKTRLLYSSAVVVRNELGAATK